MLTADESTSLASWLQEAFRGNPPAEVERLLKHREATENVLTEMMTEWPAHIKEPMQHLHLLHQADTELMYSVIKNLFIRHLESHP